MARSHRSSFLPLGAVWLRLAIAPQLARADAAAPQGHAGQVELHAQTGFGFRFIAPYDNEYCGGVKPDTGAPESVCSGRSPVTLELGAGYGVRPAVELLIDVRLGLERDVGASPGLEGPRQWGFAPGVKLYHDDAGTAKFFSSLQVAIDLTRYAQASGTDYGVRNVNGLQIDLHRTLGLYAYVGEYLAFGRWFRFELDAGIGLQARVP